jgi:AraC-like DNA-binding protein
MNTEPDWRLPRIAKAWGVGTGSNELSVAAAQLIEAAHKARNGDREAAGVHIARAVELLQLKQSVGPRGPRLATEGRRVTAGGLLAWQTRLLVAHINANLAQRIRVGELAALFGLSKSHFTRMFKRTFGVSPCTYLLWRRIEVAQGLMLTTCKPLTSIALTCGMYDQSHFTRSFQRVAGETPHFWRRTRRLESGGQFQHDGEYWSQAIPARTANVP